MGFLFLPLLSSPFLGSENDLRSYGGYVKLIKLPGSGTCENFEISNFGITILKLLSLVY